MDRRRDGAEPWPAAHPQLRVPIFGSSPSLRRSISAPNLPSTDESTAGMEVYVIQRPFVSFGAELSKRLPPSVNQLLLDVGVCHYMTVFKTPSGQLVQFDFGPKGGRDISLGPANQSRLARIFTRNKAMAVPAEIREAKIVALPDAAMLVGKTKLTLQQVRFFNQAQLLEYEVHKSDCRHYVDRLVHYATGTERAAAATAKYNYQLKRQKFHWTSGLTVCTDVMYYKHLKAASQASVAMAAMLTNRARVSRVWTAKVCQPTRTALATVPASSALRRRVIPTAGAATAGMAVAAWTDTSVIRNVLSLSEGVKRVASRGICWMGGVARSAGSTLGSSERQVLRLPFRRRQPALALARP